LTNLGTEEKPRIIFKKLVESGKVRQIEKMQIVSQVEDLNPPEDEPAPGFSPIPSMLHHINKINLEEYSLEELFSVYDQQNAHFLQ
jgi:hypothetical protein